MNLPLSRRILRALLPIFACMCCSLKSSDETPATRFSGVEFKISEDASPQETEQDEVDCSEDPAMKIVREVLKWRTPIQDKIETTWPGREHMQVEIELTVGLTGKVTRVNVSGRKYGFPEAEPLIVAHYSKLVIPNYCAPKEITQKHWLDFFNPNIKRVKSIPRCLDPNSDSILLEPN